MLNFLPTNFYKTNRFYPNFSLNNSVENQIAIEKRKRNQAYLALDYILSRVTYFDFFSSDAFKISTYSKHFAQIFQKKNVTSELLLLPFFYCESNISSFFSELNLIFSF